jgi:hypothetical protein
MPAKYGRRVRPPRNTAPMWKKLSIVLATVVVLILVLAVLDASRMGFFALLGTVVVVVAGMVWLMSKLLGVHLSLRSWD